MRKIMTYVPRSLLLVFLLTAGGCSYDFPEGKEEYTAGELDLSSFVVVGDDHPAGFMDGAYYLAGQQHSPGVILASLLQQAGMGMLEQAVIPSVNGLNVYEDNSHGLKGRYELVYPDRETETPVIVPTAGESIPPYEGDPAAVRDLAVPFLTSWQLDDPVALMANPYYTRMALGHDQETLIARVRSLHPTTFLLWLGMSDILGYAASGGEGDTLPTGKVGPTDLTPVPLFEEKVTRLVETLLEDPRAKGVIINLPRFDDLPYFYFYSYDFIKLESKMVALAKTMYRDFNDAVAANNSDPNNPKRPYIDFNDNGYTLYPQRVVVVDTTLPDAYYPDGRPLEKYRQLEEDELVLLSFPTEMLKYGMGSLIPLPERYYLRRSQVAALARRTEAFNEVLRRQAEQHPGRLVLVDIATPLHAIAMTGKLNGWGKPASDAHYEWDGVPLTARLGLYSIFSLDGIHLNKRGNAWLVTYVRQAMLEAFATRLPSVDVNNHPGNIPRYP